MLGPARAFGVDPWTVADTWPLAQCLAYAAWLAERDAWRPMEAVSSGYIEQEVEARLKAMGDRR